MALLPTGWVSPHFTQREALTTSSRRAHLVTPPSDREWLNIAILAASVLEPLRAKVGPIKVNSWYRGATLNQAVGGVRDSHHLTGCAADIQPIRVSRREMWDTLLGMVAAGLPITEAIIYEAKSHVHVSYLWWEGPKPDILVKPRFGRTVKWESYTGFLKAS